MWLTGYIINKDKNKVRIIEDRGRQDLSGSWRKHHKPSHECWSEYSMFREQFEKLDWRVAAGEDAK